MVKEKNLYITDFIKPLWNFKILKEKYKISELILYNLILLLVATIINTIANSKSSSSDLSIVQALISNLLGLPILLLILFTPLFILMKAFTDQNNKWFKTYLEFTAITLPFLIVSYSINLIQLLLQSQAIWIISAIIIAIMWLVYFFILSMNMKNIFNTDIYKPLASLIICLLIYAMVTIIVYLYFLLLQLSQF